MVTGACNCGAVQFEIDAALSGVYVCHCSICRRSTGSNGIAVVVVQNEQFRWVQGRQRIATWKKPNASWQTWFCSVCGSPVPGENDAARMFVPAGAITQGGDELRRLGLGHGCPRLIAATDWIAAVGVERGQIRRS